MDPTVIVAGIAAVASVITAWLARSNQRTTRQTQKQVRTSNGHTLGEVVESIDGELKVLRRQFVAHLEDSAIHQIHKDPTIVVLQED